MKKKELMETVLLKSFTYQITQGMCYCHQRRILHRDLKPQNLLVDVKSNTIKLADFGLARATGIPVRPFTHEVVTLWYRAPEVLLGVEKYSMSVDVWSIGCIFAEMARRRPLWQGDSEIDQLFRIFKTLTLPTELDWPGITRLPEFAKSKFPSWTKNLLRDEMEGYVDELGLDFLEGTLVRNPADRMTTKDMLLHPYFADLDKKTLPAGAYDGTVLELGEPGPLRDLENMPVA
ncbi:CBN-CDK-1 protein [Aphelenchoides avenae]|nr:CBN-CDK-1 protein [Aphelenchus avenae]